MRSGRRRWDFGAELTPDGIRFRLYAPALSAVTVVLDGKRRLALEACGGGFFEAGCEAAGAGTRYRYEIAPGDEVPDPASRFQPVDVSGPSEVIDPLAYQWRDEAWTGRPWHEAIVYELHLGCFDPAGDFDAVRRRLDHFACLGVTAIELMPVADFAGARNWGYDGVLIYAPDSSYGRPRQLKQLVDACHERKLMVFADVVYNHFGPSGNFLSRYAPDFFHPEIHTPWGAALAFENPVLRAFFIENALYWFEEYHLDGLRLDAAHAIEEVPGGAGFLAELAERVRSELPGREAHLVLENDRNESHWLPQATRPPLYTAQWNDDFHHAAHVAVSEENDGYYADYAESPVAYLARSLAQGFAYQGESSRFRDGHARGEASAQIWPAAFVNFLQNHDQVGNRAFGERLSTLVASERLRALYPLLLLAPPVPLLFMGEEWAAETPFLYFCDFAEELGAAVREGRRNEFRRFANFRDAKARDLIPDPTTMETFLVSRLDWEERDSPGHREWLEFINDLIACRSRELVPRLAELHSGRHRLLAARAFEVQWPIGGCATWTVTANLGEAPVEIPAPRGRIIHAQPGATAQDLPPWSVRVTLDE